MERYILDTNLFFNMEAGLNLGEKTEEVIRNFTKIAKCAKEDKTAQFYMPPKVVDELLSFFEDKTQSFLHEFLGEVTVQAPAYQETTVPATVIYKLVEDIRARSYRGLAVGEEEITNGARTMMGKPQLSPKDFQISVGTTVRHFRDRYRQATRFGFLDSVADLDLIMLAKQLDGTLVSTDEGVTVWGRTMGVKEMLVPVFGEKMKQYLQ